MSRPHPKRARDVRSILHARFPLAVIDAFASVRGTLTAATHRFDLVVTETGAAGPIRTAVEVLPANRRASSRDVERFIGRLRDARIDRGLIVAAGGVSPAAAARACTEAAADIDVLTHADLAAWSVTASIPHAAGDVILNAPIGWAVDATPSPGLIARLHRRGLPCRERASSDGRADVTVWPRRPPVVTAAALLDERARQLRADDASVETAVAWRTPTTSAVQRARWPDRPSVQLVGVATLPRLLLTCAMVCDGRDEPAHLRRLLYVIDTARAAGLRGTRRRS